MNLRSSFKCLRGFQLLEIQLTAERGIKEKGYWTAKYMGHTKPEIPEKHHMKKKIRRNYWSSSHLPSKAY